MSHYICQACKNSLPELGICEQEGCTSQWEMMDACPCTDGTHGAEEVRIPSKDSNGNILSTGDTVVLVKDLTLRGSSQKIKQGTKVTITLTEKPEEVDCKISGQGIVLRTEFLKKV